MPHGPQKFLERLCAQRPPVLLLSKHHCIVEIENDPAICPLKKTEFDLVESDGLEQHHHVVPRCLFQNTQPVSQTRTARRQNGGFDAEALIMLKADAQSQTSARRVAMFDDAKGFHGPSTIRNFSEHRFIRQQCVSYTRPVPQRRCRKRSQGEKRILSASKPITTITSMMAITWSIAFNSRP